MRTASDAKLEEGAAEGVAGAVAPRADAYGIVRAALLAGDLQPNERLVEADLAERFGIGRHAVRTVLTRLEQDGLVVREPNRGARVRLITPEEAQELLEIRAVLEGYAARQAAAGITPERVAVLDQLLGRLEAHSHAGDLLAYSETNAELHGAILAFAERPQLAGLLLTLKAQSVRLRYRTVLLPGRVAQSLGEHQAIVEALAAGDGERAELAARTHVLSVAAVLAAHVRSSDVRSSDVRSPASR